jgi:hypothetical protein
VLYTQTMEHANLLPVISVGVLMSDYVAQNSYLNIMRDYHLPECVSELSSAREHAGVRFVKNNTSFTQDRRPKCSRLTDSVTPSSSVCRFVPEPDAGHDQLPECLHERRLDRKQARLLVTGKSGAHSAGRFLSSWTLTERAL